MNKRIVDYRVTRKGDIIGKCVCGAEEKLTPEQARQVAQDKPEVFLKFAD